MTVIKINQLRIDSPPQSQAKHDDYLGNEPLRLERFVNRTLRSGIPSLSVGPILINLTKWRKHKRLINMVRTGLTSSDWRVTSTSVTKNHYHIFVEPAVQLPPSNRPRWATGRR